MGNKLSAGQLQEIKNAFKQFDTDNNGEITLDEFQVYLNFILFFSLK